MMKLGLGGGCHWCTEAVIQALRGAHNVEQGFIGSEPPNDALSEAVRLELDEDELPLSVLLDVHLRTHASQSAHSMRAKYRSAVYVANQDDASRISVLLKDLAKGFAKPLVTKTLRFVTFQASEETYRRYHEKRPTARFCRTYIDPKLTLLRQSYRDQLRS